MTTEKYKTKYLRITAAMEIKQFAEAFYQDTGLELFNHLKNRSQN